MIQHVVKLGAELQPHALTDWLPPAHHCVEAECAGVPQIRFCARAVAKRVLSGIHKRSCVEPLVHSGILKPAILDAVRITAEVLDTREATSGCDAHGCAGLCREDTAGLPIAENHS